MEVGVIGIGGFASKVIEKIIEHPDLHILYGFHPDSNKIKQWDNKVGTSSLEDLILSERVEAVFVLTPNHLHADYVIKAIQARKHVFVEKPLAHTLKDAERIIYVLKKNPVRFMVGHNFRRKPCYRKIKELINSGCLGRIVNVTINHSHGAIFTLPESSWRKKVEFHPEGPLSTVGIHFFDLLHYWFGKISSLDAIISNVAGKSSAPDANAVMILLENGGSVFLQTNYCQCSESTLYIFGTEGTIYCDRNNLALRMGRDHDRTQSIPQPINLPNDNSLEEEIDEFYKNIVDDYPIETGSFEAFNAMIILDACNVSHN